MVNLLNNWRAVSAYVVTSLLAAALLLALLRFTGLGWEAAGLGRDALARGLRWGLVLAAVVAACYVVAALLPPTRGLFLDRRVEGIGAGTLAYQTLVRIPFGTVWLEEVAFRGVLYGLAAHLYGAAWATVVSSVLFGLWHVLPARELAALNPSVRTLARGWTVPAAVVATALAGIVLCELRRRTGSLAPVLAVHWATNAIGYVTAFVVTRRSGRTR